ncbi:MAG: HAD-IIB family hydrolase [Granulosicoccus sp.]
MKKTVVFTDLDGTLLDHETYDYSAALPALKALQDRGIPVILASSKTGAEMRKLRQALQLQRWPAIVENGAGELAPGDDADTGAHEYQQLRSMLAQIPVALRALFHGFGDMRVEEIAQITGLDNQSASLAKQRAYTEPGCFKGSDEQYRQFASALEQHGISVRKGGRFSTLSFGRSKADGMRHIAKRLQATFTVALGDAPNDREMLLAATQAIIVHNTHATSPGDIPGAIVTERAGPAGWNEAMLALIDSHNL